MKILILGGSGFVGTYLNKYFSKLHTVVSTSRDGRDGTLIFDLGNEKTHSILDDEYDVIINCLVNYKSVLSLKIKEEVLGKISILERISKQVLHYIDVSSISAIEENKKLSEYNFAKFLSDEVVSYLGNTRKLQYTILRYAQIFDEDGRGRSAQKGFYYFVDMFKNQQKLNVFGNADAKRSYVPIEVLVRSVDKTIQDKITGIHNVIMPDKYSANDLIREFSKKIQIPEENILYKPNEAAVEYYIPLCSPSFESFMSEQYSCAYYFNQLLEK